MTIYVSSTTGTQQDVDDAANYDPDRPKESPESPSEVEETESAAEPEPAESPESTEEEEEEKEPEPGEEPELEEPPEAARRGTKSRLVHRVNQLVGQRYALQDENHQLREQIRQLQEGQKGPDKAPQQPQALRRPEPSDPKYKGRPYEEFVEDLADFKVKERELLKAQAEQDAFTRQIFDDYNAQVEVARGKFDDFDEVVGKDVQVPVVAINAMYELDNGPEVAYYLGKHPEVREQLLDWNEPGTKGGIRRIVVELDRISKELEGPSSASKNGRAQTTTTAASSPRPRSATPTPAPIRPLGGASASAGPATVGDPSKMDYQQYKRWYQKHYGGR